MALNFADRVYLLPSIRPRVQAAVLKYALYIVGGGTAANPNNANMATWAKDTLRANLSVVVDAVAQYMLDEPNYIAGGSDVTDAQIGGRAEFAINTYLVTPLP